MKKALFIILILSFFSCSKQLAEQKEELPYIVFLVDAPKLDYSSSQKLLSSLVKNPHTAQKDGYVGHAWFYLKGFEKQGNLVELEGGHSGELGIACPKYFEGIMNLMEFGVVTPSIEDKKKPKTEENPIKYLWSNLNDGYFQSGSGGHKPTLAAKFQLSQKQFDYLLTFITPQNYNFSSYCLTNHQCVTLINQIAGYLGHPLECEIAIPIQKDLILGKRKYTLWENTDYSILNLPSPDILENSLKKKIVSKEAEDVLAWYLQNRYPLYKRKKSLFFVDFMTTLPWRIQRWALYRALKA